MNGPFSPTHRIQTDRETVDVMLDDNGAAYTQQEWEETLTADYELHDGRWYHLGQPFTGTVVELTDADRTQILYRGALARVRYEDRLAQHSATILDDHGDGDRHWQWVIDADTDEIVAWAEGHQ